MAAPAADQTGHGRTPGQRGAEPDPNAVADPTGEPTPSGEADPTGEAARTAEPTGEPAPVTRLVVALVEYALIIVGLALVTFGQKHQMIGDGLQRFQALVELLQQHRVSDTSYSMIGPLFAAPLWSIGQLRGDPQGWTVYYNALLFTLALGALHLLLRDRMDRDLLRRFLLLLVAGSMIAPHVLDFYGEIFTATTVGVGLLAATLPGTSRLTRGAGWVGVVLGVANTPASLVGLVGVVVVLAARKRRLRYLLVIPVTAAVISGESWLRHGDPFHSAYVNNGGGPTVLPYSGLPGFSYPFLLGLVAILFSFGKGLLWFIPGLFLPVRRRLREVAGAAAGDLWSIWLLWTVFAAGLVLVYAKWWAWYGGMYWGPRFFLIAILPASLALALWLAPRRFALDPVAADRPPSRPAAADPPASRPSVPARVAADVVALGVLFLAVWGAANSMVYGQLWPWKCYENSYYLEGLCHFTPEYSSLWYPLVAPPELTGIQRQTLAFYGLVLLWLGVPLLVRIGRQVGTALLARRSTLLSAAGWRW